MSSRLERLFMGMERVGGCATTSEGNLVIGGCGNGWMAFPVIILDAFSMKGGFGPLDDG